MKVMVQNHYCMIFKEKTNLSLIYLLPLVAETDDKWYAFKNEYIPQSNINTLINGYRADINKPWLDKHVFLMFESAADKNFDIEILRSKRNFHSMYNYRLNKKFYNIVVFTVPKEYKEVYDNIIEDQTGLIPIEVKKRILSFWLYNERINVYKMLYPEKSPIVNYNPFKNEIIGEKDDIEDWFEEIWK